MTRFQSLVFLVGFLAFHGSLSRPQPRSSAELRQLFESLKSSNLETKNQASQELLAYSKWWIQQDVAKMRESLPTALAILDDPNPAVRKQASAFFGLVATLRRDDLPALLSGMEGQIISHCEDPSHQVRGNMLRALALWDPSPPQAAIDSFQEALDDSSGEVRSLAVYGLVRAAPKSDSAAQAIADAFDAQEPEARRELVRSLEYAQADHTIIIRKLIEQLDEHNQPLVYTTARALGSLGSKASDAVPKLRSIAEDPDTDDQLRDAVTSAVRSIERGSSPNRRP